MTALAVPPVVVILSLIHILGAGALAGTTYPLDREYTASLLGFEGPTLNSMDSRCV